jgi:hypothetical protein
MKIHNKNNATDNFFSEMQNKGKLFQKLQKISKKYIRLLKMGRHNFYTSNVK